jgi:hypothetical protein
MTQLDPPPGMYVLPFSVVAALDQAVVPQREYDCKARHGILVARACMGRGGSLVKVAPPVLVVTSHPSGSLCSKIPGRIEIPIPVSLSYVVVIVVCQ